MQSIFINFNTLKIENKLRSIINKSTTKKDYDDCTDALKSNNAPNSKYEVDLLEDIGKKTADNYENELNSAGNLAVQVHNCKIELVLVVSKDAPYTTINYPILKQRTNNIKFSE